MSLTCSVLFYFLPPGARPCAAFGAAAGAAGAGAGVAAAGLVVAAAGSALPCTYR